MNLKNRFFLAAILLIASISLAAEQKSGDKATVAASTFSLYDIAKNIASDTAETFMILPFGVDAHSYEPTPKDMIKISRSDLVLYSGAGLEPWIDGFEFKNRAVDVSRYVELIELGKDKHKHDHDDHHHDRVDPHYWQDPHNMMLAAERITEELIALFPKNREFYMKNRESYIAMLKNLDKDYKEQLSSCQLDTIIVNHNAFSYLANRYSFHTKALSGLSPEAEPSAKSMIKLVKFIKEHRVETIFFEKFANEKTIKSIAEEAGVSYDVLQPLGNITADEAKEKLSYEDIMRRNLQKISKALKCR
ncbi:metal ABC transporter substrate-binding protein [Sulfurimonas sp.]|jgi:zinc transport system substrate-binding protein|uniref:metal ABC transporter substrate-binding protein n=1 Tax=Sulfurimonas sp. TaxID=2022749 RepID=UPI002A35EE3E|nr:metal ABC transporter substrate-binding protein [Sulfurimonas sp.]MDY0122575.1 metal ABC transporter substrate-binding protein [Sulfurimonas sp.]